MPTPQPRNEAHTKKLRSNHDFSADSWYAEWMVDLVPPNALADFLLVSCREQGEILTNLKLQKLMYYSQAWHLALKGSALFDEDFQAWVHGPVLPSQFFRFRNYQWRPILDDIVAPEIEEPSAKFLEEIIDVFGSETAVALELMTHRERPWVEARGNLPIDALSNNVITKDSMKTYYRELGEELK
jgi:uncharacterized phage-associated protein